MRAFPGTSSLLSSFLQGDFPLARIFLREDGVMPFLAWGVDIPFLLRTVGERAGEDWDRTELELVVRPSNFRRVARLASG